MKGRQKLIASKYAEGFIKSVARPDVSFELPQSLPHACLDSRRDDLPTKKIGWREDQDIHDNTRERDHCIESSNMNEGEEKSGL